MGKSAILFSLACSVGGSEAKAPKAVVERLRRSGYNIGMAFQIIDDILDYAGDPSTVRKPLGNDIREGLITLPLIAALPLDTTGTLRWMFSASSFSVPDGDAVIRLVNECGGVEAARAFAGNYTNRALREIALLPEGGARALLEKLARRLLGRNS
jgi:heptaprenyl diphosphate synthase